MKQNWVSNVVWSVPFGLALILILLAADAGAADVLDLSSIRASSLRNASTRSHRYVPLERWAGRQVVLGEQDFTLVGTVDTRAESFVIADVRRYPDRYVMTQYTCRVDMAEVAGVSAKMTDATAQSTPPVTIEIPRDRRGRLAPVTWVSDWGDSDLDGDGERGATVAIGAPLCGGDLYLSSRTTTKAYPFERDAALEASVDVTVEQRILDTSNLCLDLATSDSREQVSGRVKYLPVAKHETCASLLRKGWPVSAPL